MYEELIKALHEGAEFLECSTPGIKNSFAEMCRNAADAIDELSRENESLAKSVNEASEILRKRWIPVTERLPEECGKYLTAYSDGYVTENEWCFIGLTAVGWSYDRDAVTHWMPLPEPPKEG